MTPTPRAAAKYTAEQLTELLHVGAKYKGFLPYSAAIHLVTFTELPGSRALAECVEVIVVNVPPPGQVLAQGEDVLAAFVDFEALALSPTTYLGGGDHRLLTLALGLAKGVPINLQDNVGSFGHAHARRVIEAFAIATGADEFYAVVETPALAEMRAANDAMFARTSQQLPTWDEIEQNAEECRRKAYGLIGDAQDWIRSDWHPVGTSLTDTQAASRDRMREGYAAAKEALNRAARH